MSNATPSVTYDPDAITTDTALLRLLVGDSDPHNGVRPSGANFSDAELGKLLTVAGSVGVAVRTCMLILASEYAAYSQKSAILGDDEAAKQYLAISTEYRLQATGAESVSDLIGSGDASGSFESVAFGYDGAGNALFQLPPVDLR